MNSDLLVGDNLSVNRTTMSRFGEDKSTREALHGNLQFIKYMNVKHEST